MDLKRFHPRVKSRVSARKGRGSLGHKRVHRSRVLNLLEIIVKTPVVAARSFTNFQFDRLGFQKTNRPNHEGSRNVHRLSRSFPPVCPEGSNESRFNRIKPKEQKREICPHAGRTKRGKFDRATRLSFLVAVLVNSPVAS